MRFSNFASAQDSHAHSLEILELMYQYDDFMESVGTVADLGCGKSCLDMQWWATRTTRDEEQIPLDIQCVGFDILDTIDAKHKNISYQKHDLETLETAKRKYDILWCHDTFQYLLDPLGCLKRWRGIANDNAMLVMSIPQTTFIQYNQQEFNILPGQYYHFTLTNLLYMLAVNGWDCKDGFFKKEPEDNWIHLIVYKSDCEPLDPRTSSWYDVAETGLLPETAEASINRYGHVRQPDLVLPWLDKSLSWFAQQ